MSAFEPCDHAHILQGGWGQGQNSVNVPPFSSLLYRFRLILLKVQLVATAGGAALPLPPLQERNDTIEIDEAISTDDDRRNIDLQNHPVIEEGHTISDFEIFASGDRQTVI